MALRGLLFGYLGGLGHASNPDTAQDIFLAEDVQVSQVKCPTNFACTAGLQKKGSLMQVPCMLPELL